MVQAEQMRKELKEANETGKYYLYGREKELDQMDYKELESTLIEILKGGEGMNDKEILRQWELQREQHEQRAKIIWRKIKWHLATQQELNEYAQIMCIDRYADTKELPVQICEFKNAAAFVIWTMKGKAATLRAYLKK